MGIVEQYLLQLNTEKRRWRRAVAILTALSLIVALVTTWNLRMTGITIANSASCGYEEHQHDEACWQDGVPVCGKQSHIHNTDCYSNPKADVETSLDWQKMFANYPYTGVLREDLVGIAKTQVGYTESQQNFEVSDTGQRKGYSRYGVWYGAPYQDWSAMFVSFCLSYAKADPEAFPNSSGAASMAELWKAQGKYIPAGDYIPQSGDIVFFDNNTVGIVTEVNNATFGVIRGDQEDAVTTGTLLLNDGSITGWGSTETPRTPPTDTTEPSTEATEPSTDTFSPVFVIIEGDAPQMQTQSQAQTFSLRATRTITELIPYLEANGGNYFFTLLDMNNVELPKDADGNYIAEAQKGYKLTLTFNSPKGFLPGTYQYQIPNGLMVDGGEGEFVLKAGENITPFSIFAAANGSVADIQAEDGVHTEHRYDLTHTVVHNSKGVVLPSTGGEGTFWLITIGTLLAIGFAVFLITHKKMSVYTD